MTNAAWALLEYGVLRPVFWIDEHVPLPPVGRAILGLPLVPIFAGGMLCLLVREPALIGSEHTLRCV